MEPIRPEDERGRWYRRFVADPLLLVGAALWALSLLPSFLPIFSADFTYAYADQYSDAIPLVVALLAMGLASRTLDSRERGFWLLVGVALLSWLGTRVVYTFVSVEAWSASWDLVTDLLYLTGYLLLATALERRPDRAPPSGHQSQLQQVEVFGTILFTFGLLGYFIVVPKVFNPDVYASWVPSLLLYSVLDAFLIVRVISILATHPRRGWTWPYRWLLATFVLWLAGDLIEGMLYLEVIPWIDPGTPLDVIWHLPALALLMAPRSRLWHDPREDDGIHVPGFVLRRFRPGGRGLTTFALALPAIHFLLGSLGLTDPSVERAQMALLLALLVAFGGLLIWYQLLLRNLASAMEADRSTVANQLQMAQRMEAVGRLAAGVAHDFSNVLSVIRGRAELLLWAHRLNPQEREDVEEVVEATRRGQGLVSHLLTISRRKSGDPHTLDLSDVVLDVRDLLDRVLPETVAFSVKTSEEVPLVTADRAQLEQVALNLVLNARDAVEGRGSVRVTTEVVEVDDQFAAAHGGGVGGVYSVLRVEDSGPGVPPEIRELIFEPFFTTKDADRGSGIGLSVVYGIVRQSKGLIRVDRSADGGALFEAYFPLAQGRVARGRLTGGGHLLPGRETVLLVENHGPVRRTMARVLRESGYRVLEAESGVVGLAILERRNEDVSVLVTDLALPDLTGYELQQQAVEKRPGLAVVMVTGHPEGVTPLRAPENTLVLRKPVAPDLLTMSVRRALAEARESAG